MLAVRLELVVDARYAVVNLAYGKPRVLMHLTFLKSECWSVGEL